MHGLKCYKRTAHELVPGWLGYSTKYSDYCYKEEASKNELVVIDEGVHAPGTLGVCEGDCETDAECAAGLRCFQRNNDDVTEYAPVPGCSGKGMFNMTTALIQQHRDMMPRTEGVKIKLQPERHVKNGRHKRRT